MSIHQACPPAKLVGGGATRIEHVLANLKFAILPLNYTPSVNRAKRGSNPKSTDLQSVCSTILPPQPFILFLYKREKQINLTLEESNFHH